MPVPKYATSYSFPVAVTSVTDPSDFQSSPTISAGDFQISLDDSAFENLDNLPVVTPAGTKIIKVTLSADEMTGSKAVILGSDVAGGEWRDILTFIDIPTGSIEDATDGIILGNTIAGTLSTQQASTDLTGYAVGQLIGRVIIFLPGGLADGEASAITGSTADGLINYNALTVAPEAGDPFKIV